MQIGNIGDPALKAFFTGNEGGYLIIPPAWKGRLSMNSSVSNPIDNIKAGVGFLLMKLANKDIKLLINEDKNIYTVTVDKEKTLNELSNGVSSTVEIMKKMNPNFLVLKKGQVWKYKKSEKRKIITGWKIISIENIYKFYNNKDINYQRKLQYALKIM